LTDDLAHMDRAVALARHAEGHTSPNPAVGCVIVRDGRVVGEGWHEAPGRPHAEAMALAAAGGSAQGSTAYVTLEPCAHHGRTPPCADALIAAGVASVVYAVADPNPLARGGADRLRAAGLDVRHLPHEGAAELTRGWCHFVRTGRPYVFAKFAASLDGRIATRDGESKWITGPQARGHGHGLRQRTDAIIVGIGTVLADDPGLDPRPEDIAPAPGLKVVLDRQGRTPVTARLLDTPGEALIVCSEDAPADRRRALAARGAEVLALPRGADADIWPPLLERLTQRAVVSAMIEGGARVLGSAFDAGVVDEVWAFLGPRILGSGRSAVEGEGGWRLADAPRLAAMDCTRLGDDILIRGRIMEGSCSLG
jgi:diaminohydroxyphosphoribosylaminopyrimidine deaminase/5-amino-6-(5-phosphoribosylamino)uracil reductase